MNDKYVLVWGMPKRKGNKREPGFYQVSPEGRRHLIAQDEVPEDTIVEFELAQPLDEQVVALKGTGHVPIAVNFAMGVVLHGSFDRDGDWQIRVDLGLMRSFLRSLDVEATNTKRQANTEKKLDHKYRLWLSAVQRGDVGQPAIAWIHANSGTTRPLDRKTITAYLNERRLPRTAKEVLNGQ